MTLIKNISHSINQSTMGGINAVQKRKPEKLKEDEFAVNGIALRRDYIGPHKTLKEKIDKLLGDIDLWESNEKTITVNGIIITFYKRLTGVHRTAAAKEVDREKIEVLLGLKRQSEKLKEDEFAVNGIALFKDYIQERKLTEKIDKLLGNVNSWESNERTITRNGITITFYKRSNGPWQIAAAKEVDRKKVEDILKLKRKRETEKLKEDEFTVNGRALSKYYVGDEKKLKEKVDKLLGDINSWKSNEKIVTVNGITITFYKRLHGSQQTAAAKEVDRKKIEDILELKRKGEIEELEGDEFAVNGGALRKDYIGSHETLKEKTDKLLGNIDSWESNEKIITVNGITITFYKRLTGIHLTAAAKEVDRKNVEIILRLKRVPEKLKKNEFAVNGNALSKDYAQVHHLAEKVDKLLGNIDSWESNEKTITVNGITVTFYKRLNGSNLIAAAKEIDRKKVEDILKLKGKGETEKLKKDEFAVNGGALSENYVGGPTALKEKTDKLLGDIDSWKGNERTITKNGITITFYRRLNGSQTTAATKEVDRKKVEDILGLVKKEDKGLSSTEARKIVSSEVSKEVEELFQDNSSFFATRYFSDIRNILWGIVGTKLEGKYDKEKLKNLIDSKLLNLALNAQEDESECESEYDEISEINGISEPEESVIPKKLTEEELKQEEISLIAEKLNKKIEKEIIDSGLKEILKNQAFNFIKKLEEKHFFKKYYEKSLLNIKNAISLALEDAIKEQNTLLEKVLFSVLVDTENALRLENVLYEKGLNKNTKLNLYQLIGIMKLLDMKKAGLFDEMGLGKTMETICTFLLSDSKEMLTICPKAAVHRWIEDISFRTDTEIELVLACDENLSEELKDKINQNKKINLVTFNKSKDRYEYLLSCRKSPERKRIILFNYEAVPFLQKYAEGEKNEKRRIPKTDFIALDEVHKLKNPKTKTSEVIFGDAHENGNESRSENGNGIQAEHKIVQTGAPLENEVSDLLYPFKYLAKGGSSDTEKLILLLDRKSFTNTFSPVNLGNISALHNFISERTVRRLKDDVISGLPEKRFFTCTLNPFNGMMVLSSSQRKTPQIEHLNGNYLAQYELYEFALNNPNAFENTYGTSNSALSDLEEEVVEEDEESGNGRSEISKSEDEFLAKRVSTQLIRLEQSAISTDIFGVNGDSIKFHAIRKILEEKLKENKSTLIFTDYKSASTRLKDFLSSSFPDEDISYVDGNITNTKTEQKRAKEVKSFQSKRSKIMIATVGTMGLACELTQADTIIFLNRTWKPSTENQAIDRAHRIDKVRNYPGKTLEIIYVDIAHPLISIDVLKTKVNERKKILSEMVVDGNLVPSVLETFNQNERSLVEDLKAIRKTNAGVSEAELSLLQELRLKIGQIVQTNNTSLWNDVAELYSRIVEHKGTLFANMASLDYLSSDIFSELKTKKENPLKTLDLCSGPSTLEKAYRRKSEELNERGVYLDIYDYDMSEKMLAFGIRREGRQFKGTLKDLDKLPEDSFDVINFSFGYRYSENPGKLIKDIHSKLKDNGLFILILPPTNIIPESFIQEHKLCGFDVKIGQQTKLKSKLDKETYKELVLEYGVDIANDIAKQAMGEFTYFIARKNKETNYIPKSENLKLLRKTPKLSIEKVQKLVKLSSKYLSIPRGSKVDGEVIVKKFTEYEERKIKERSEKREQIEKDKKNGEAPESKELKKIRKTTSEISRLASIYYSSRKKSRFKHDSDLRKIDDEITKRVEYLSGLISTMSFNDEEKTKINENLNKLQERNFVRQWFLDKDIVLITGIE